RHLDGHQESQDQRDPPSLGIRRGCPGREPQHFPQSRIPPGAHKADPTVRRRRCGGQAGRETEIRGARHMSILAVLEHNGQQWHRMSWETLAAAQQLAGELNTTASAALLRPGGQTFAQELAGKQLDKVYLVDHELLEPYTPDGFATALRQLIAQAKPTLVLFPHTYQVRDFLPKLATSLGRVAVTDVVSHRIENGQIVFV